MRTLVAAFEPFDGRTRNRAERAARRLAEDVEVVTLPTEFARLPAAIGALLARDPDVLLLVGESRRARGLEVERFAVNLADARIPDNAGARPRGVPLDPEGPPARQVRCDVDALVRAIVRAGVPAHASAHAGTFCCNAALYHALAPAGVLGRSSPIVAFIHVPARRSRMRAKLAARGLRAALDALAAPSDKGLGQGG